MKNYCERIKPHWDLELAAAARAESDGDPHLAFRHLGGHGVGQGAKAKSPAWCGALSA